MVLASRAGRGFALASILAMVIVYSASVAAACPGGGGEAESARLIASPSSLDFRTVGEEDVRFQYFGFGSITTESEGARFGGREPEDYGFVTDECRSVRLTWGNYCVVYGVGQHSTRASTATLTVRENRIGGLSATTRLIGG